MSVPFSMPRALGGLDRQSSAAVSRLTCRGSGPAFRELDVQAVSWEVCAGTDAAQICRLDRQPYPVV